MRFLLSVLLCVTTALVYSVSSAEQAAHPPQQRERLAATVRLIEPGPADPQNEGRVVKYFPGSLGEAEDYYEDSALQIDVLPATYQGWSADDLLEHLGYSGLSMLATPCDLMAEAKRQDEILSFRFFAPKTSSVDKSGHPSEIGWRQIIRLTTRDDSPAFRSGRGLAAAYILLNYQKGAAAAAGDPFTGNPFYTQVMLVFDQPAVRQSRWLLFDQNLNLEYAIRATFTGGDAARKGVNLFVPNACAQCHGGKVEQPHLNILDNDHWADSASATGLFDAVPDADVLQMGACSTKPLEVARKLNASIQQHNETPGLQTPSFVLSGGASWLAKHSGDGYVALPDRSHGTTAYATADEKELLGLMSRYCYRCHGTIRFDILDRTAVKTRSALAIELMQKGKMPLDRRGDRALPKIELDRMVELMQKLHDSK